MEIKSLIKKYCLKKIEKMTKKITWIKNKLKW